MSFMPLFLQTEGSTQTPQGGLGISGLIFLIAMILIMYFFMIRPQNKRQKETQRMIDALKKGDKVITIGGIHGTISQTKESTVVVKVDDNTKIEFNRTAIASVIVDKPAGAEAEKKGGFFGFGKKSKKDKKTEEKKEAKAEEKSAETEEKKDNE